MYCSSRDHFLLGATINWNSQSASKWFHTFPTKIKSQQDSLTSSLCGAAAGLDLRLQPLSPLNDWQDSAAGPISSARLPQDKCDPEIDLTLCQLRRWQLGEIDLNRGTWMMRRVPVGNHGTSIHITEQIMTVHIRITQCWGQVILSLCWHMFIKLMEILSHEWSTGPI